MQLSMDQKFSIYYPPKTQLLKWVGNKQRFASIITQYFPQNINRYFEPFLGSGAILATVAPNNGIASDSFKPLIDIWKTLKKDPKLLIEWYAERRNQLESDNKKYIYEKIKASYNSNPNAADFLYLSRSCYGGVIRFRKNDGYMSTPCGAHTPIPTHSFEKRVFEWNARIKNTEFMHIEFEEAFQMVQKGDLVYCDPPYSYSQAILYGAQSFSLEVLFNCIDMAKSKGAMVALSIDGNKKSGNYLCNLPIPKALFERELLISCGRSMLKRFQMNGKTLVNEDVSDRLLLSF
ncbi:MAG: Dam family site-specific DNA-(adenine-N6)-methyltransferase [bacterium]|nr:Dam family site-specific DNA-(adenine-N6)-methyltransferase [bacterium]